MAALTALPAVENPNKVWSRVTAMFDSLAAGTGTVAASAQAKRTFLREIKQYLSTQGRNPQLRFTALGDEMTTASDGGTYGSGATTLYAVYLKPTASADGWAIVIDDGTDDNISGLTASVVETLNIASSGREVIVFYPKGLALANGLRVAAVTAPQGLTLNASGQGAVGFAITGGAIVN